MPSSVLSAPRLQAEDRFSAVVEQAEVAARNYDTYQEWALKTYGDSAKTKTVTRKKYSRIVKILRGEESSSMENSKFRFWVKAKGFRLGLNDSDSSNEILYVPASKSTAASAANCLSKNVKDLLQYKRVAVVENFYDIIYNVHVEMDGRSGRHAGQKRTYRAVAEMYAFLPREAVTRFLMSCSDCQKRMHLQYNNGNNSNNNTSSTATPFSVLSNKKNAISLTSPLLNSSVAAVRSTSDHLRSAVQPDEGTPDEDEEEEEEDGEVEEEEHSDNLSVEKGACRVLLDCRSNPVVDIEDGICSTINAQGITSLRGEGRGAGSNASHTRQHPGQAISRRANGTSNKRKVATKSTSASASAESSSIPKRMRTSQDHYQMAGHSLEDEEDTEDRSDNLVVVGFDESNGSIDESTSETHLNESGKKNSGSGNRTLVKLQGHHNEIEKHEDATTSLVAAAAAASRVGVVSPSEIANSIEANKRSFPVSGVSSNGESTGELVVESKLRTRERLLAALTNLNGVTGVTRSGSSSSSSSKNQYQQHQQEQQLKPSVTASNVNNNSGISSSGLGNSCNSPQPVSPSVSDIGMKDEEEDEEDDDEGEGLLAMHAKEANGDFDPERLKAFNMFVRLFVDENLDRMVPISRQPKDKIQAIIDSCHRQFPEFTDRARKRIRTYLKSCRRTRKHKSSVCASDSQAAAGKSDADSTVATATAGSTSHQLQSAMNGSNNSHINGGSGSSSSSGSSKTNNNISCNGQMVSFTSSGNSYHMTSSLAEQILATACDNEYQNAKRMRLGLKPLAVDYDEIDMSSCFSSSTSIGTSVGAVQVLKAKNSAHTSSSLLAALCHQQQSESESKLRSECITSGKRSLTCTDFLDSSEKSERDSTCGSSKNADSLVTSSGGGGGGGSGGPLANGTTIASDFTVCKSIRSGEAGSAVNHHQQHSLNPTESAMVKQLISGYRESAAFLLRSADELEQLLLRQG